MHIYNVQKLGKELWSFILGMIGCCGTLTAGVHGIKVKYHKSSTASNNTYYYLSCLTLLHLVHCHFYATAATCCQLLFCCSLLSLQILPYAVILHFSHFFKPSMHISTCTVTHTWNSEFYFIIWYCSFVVFIDSGIWSYASSDNHDIWILIYKIYCGAWWEIYCKQFVWSFARYWRKNL